MRLEAHRSSYPGRSICRYDRAPLIRPILFKAACYWAVMFVARLLEHWNRFWLIEHHPLGNSCRKWLRCSTGIVFVAIQLRIFVLFLIYETATELNHLFGEGELWHLLVPSRPSELPLNRRQRNPRARPFEQACGCPLDRRIARSDHHRAYSISRNCAPDRAGSPGGIPSMSEGKIALWERSKPGLTPKWSPAPNSTRPRHTVARSCARRRQHSSA